MVANLREAYAGGEITLDGFEHAVAAAIRNDFEGTGLRVDPRLQNFVEMV